MAGENNSLPDWQKLAGWFPQLSTSQQAMLVFVAVLLLGSFGWLMIGGVGSAGKTPLLIGKTFSVEEIIRAEEAMLAAGLDDFERRGQRLYVPKGEIEKYNNVLITSGTLPQNWAEEWERQYDNIGPFANNKQMEIRKEIARAKYASLMIASMPDVDYANVVWDEQEKRGWSHQPRTTATVSIRPKPGREITQSAIRSIQRSIMGMKADLAAEDVTVLDLGRGMAFNTDPADDPFSNGLLKRIDHLKEMYRDEVLRVIGHIDHVRVAVNVDIEKVKSAITRRQKIDAKGTTALVTNTTSQTKDYQQAPVRAEPGQRSNSGMDVTSYQGTQRTEKVSDTNENTISAPSYEVTEESVIGAMPENVKVSVVIPEQYYQLVAIQTGAAAADADAQTLRTAAGTVKTQVNTEIQAQVAQVVPMPAGADTTQYVSISSYVGTQKPEVVLATPMTESIGRFLANWGSALGLALFALIALYLLNSTVQKSNAMKIPEIPLPEQEQKAEEEDPFEDNPLMPSKDTKKRDHLQHLVRDNPEMTAAILTKWLNEAK